MKFIKFLIVIILFYWGGTFYRDRRACRACDEEKLEMETRCISSEGGIYLRPNCFCDNSLKWKQLSEYIKQPEYKFKIYDYNEPSPNRQYVDYYFGVEEFPCGNWIFRSKLYHHSAGNLTTDSGANFTTVPTESLPVFRLKLYHLFRAKLYHPGVSVRL